MGQSRLFRDESLVDDAGVMHVDVPRLEEPLDVLPRRNSYDRLKSGFAQGLQVDAQGLDVLEEVSPVDGKEGRMIARHGFAKGVEGSDASG